GLYAVGEVASTGVHGANRLASNSLLECLVFAAQLADLSQAQQPVESAAGSQSQDVQTELLKPAVQHWLIQQEKLSALRRELPLLVWQNAGICREHHALEAAVTQVETWRAEFAQLPLSQLLLNLKPAQPVKVPLPEADLQIRAWAETSTLLDVALLVLKSARFRTESRGGHYRLDYPQPDPNWQVHTLVQNNNWWKSAPLAFKANLVNNVAK
ncbi:MAG TPA: FAD-binding protein, partial [Candidatus Caenarcaniphilales bacterium]